MASAQQPTTGRSPEYTVDPRPVGDAVPQQNAGRPDAAAEAGFTELERVSVDTDDRPTAGDAAPQHDDSHARLSGRARSKVDHAKERLEGKQTQAKTQFRKAFGLKQDAENDPRKWMHGDVFICVHEADHLPGDPTLVSSACFPRFLNTALVGCQHVVTGKYRAPQPYVSIRVGNLRGGYTSISERTFYPKWEEKFRLPVAISPRDIEFQVKDADAYGSPHLGVATLPAEEIMATKRFEGWLKLRGRTGRVQGLGKAAIRVTVIYEPVEDILAKQEEATKWDLVPAWYSPRTGARVSLYNDSHHGPGYTPSVKLGNGEMYRSGDLWKDIYQGMLNAKHFIYVAGWSVWVHNMLVRVPDKPMIEDENFLELGSLLKRKAQEGVKCCVLIWDDRTSVNVGGLKTSGMLSTHDEETKQFFQNTGVVVGKSLRGNQGQKNILKGITTATNFTHHQKIVVLDVPDIEAPGVEIDPKTGTPYSTEAGRSEQMANGQPQPSGYQAGNPSASGVPRRVVAFIGGIDLCDGRYDMPSHPLFVTLPFEHSRDVYQDCIPNFDAEAGGPRLPWHDQHSRLEGPPAFDVYDNFVKRWKHPDNLMLVTYMIARRLQQLRLMKDQSSSANAEALFDIRSAADLKLPRDLANPCDPHVFVADPSRPEAWRSQVLRSIDSQCVVEFPEDNQAAFDRGLFTDRGTTKDKSIQLAYIHAIRSAKRFLYIENQYFLGGSGEWENRSHADICDQLVPIEIALRCAKAVLANEAFAAYVVIPMWPEGIPEAGSVQEVLLWQTYTIRMMYRIVARAIALKGDTNAHPRDYLNIFCPGTREPVDPKIPPPKKEPKKGSRQALIVHETRRFMIYVHAKMLVVDDEYVIIGSANINQRSMDGGRDTEIAAGNWQPNFQPKGRGMVYGHRMACWEEHLGRIDDLFQTPNDVRCVRRVRELTAANWQAYVSPKVQALPHGHLLPYPLEVAQNGVVRPLEGFRHFPDTKADVTGKKIQVPFIVKQCLGRTEYVVTT